MPLTKGTQLEHYEIVEPLGAGGMGEVYRAVDTKLKREVALKILPPKFAADPGRLVRFEREAHLLAQLNHPNIAAIYGLEHSEGIRFLVLELVEGQTLDERLKAEPMKLGEALRIAVAIAEALEAAHEKGVVHRDLKPGNVKITPQGKVKVLDFGLAKAMGEPEPSASEGDPSGQSTATLQETKAGVVMGTAAYMSPEQAEGKPTDKRSDVWSFGVVLYEMLSGKRCFDGKSTSHIIVHLLEDEPDWTKLPESVPPGLRWLLERCLDKDPGKRLRDVGDLRLQLEGIARDGTAAPKPARVAVTPRREPKWVWPGLAAVALAAVAVGLFYLRPKPAPVQAMRFDIAAPEGTTLTDGFSVSPDGHKLAFMASGADNVSRVWVRSLDSGEAQPLSGTENAVAGTIPAVNPPIWSPDSRSLVYSTFPGTQRFFRVEASGGAPQEIQGIGGITASFGGFWTSDNRIVLAQLTRSGGIRAIPLSGGKPVPVVQPRVNGVYPYLLPDGHHFLYSEISSGPGFTVTGGNLMVGNLDASPDQQTPKKILPEPTLAAFIPDSAHSGRGYLLFLRSFMRGSGVLMAQAFDAKTLEFSGEPVTIAEQVGTFAAAPAGVLVYRPSSPSVLTQPQGQDSASPSNRPTWYERQGKQLEMAVEEPGLYTALALSPDEKQLAATRLESTASAQIWVFDLARKSGRRFTFSQLDTNPVWSPDGQWIVYESTTAGHHDLYIKPSNGAGDAQLLSKSGSGKAPTSWSRDGRFLLVHDVATRGDLTVLPVKGGTIDAARMPYVFESKGSGGRSSPDMRWIAYVSRESGAPEIWVRPFDAASPTGSTSGGKWMISRGGGSSVRWRGDGRELFYASSDGTIMSVEVNTKPGSPVFDAGVPKPLFKGSPVLGVYWDVSADGKRFLLDSEGYNRPVSSAPVPNAPYKVVLNWTTLMTRKR